MRPQCKYGIKAENLTEKILKEIVTIHDQIVGGRGLRYFDDKDRNLDGFFRAIQSKDHHNSIERTYASSVSMFSKLWADRCFIEHEKVIHFCFSGYVENNAPEKLKVKEKELEETFHMAVDDYLIKNNLAVDLSSW